MKNLLWLLTACFLFSVPFAAEAQFPPTPKSRPAAASQVAQAEVPASAPTPVQAASPVINVAPSPVVVPTPSTLDEIKSWLMTFFGGIIAAAFGKIAVTGVKTTVPVPAVDGAPSPLSGIATVLNKLKDPDTEAGLKALGYRVVQSGLPGMAIQTGLGLLPPPWGALLAKLEPAGRAKVLEVLASDEVVKTL